MRGRYSHKPCSQQHTIYKEMTQFVPLVCIKDLQLTVFSGIKNTIKCPLAHDQIISYPCGQIYGIISVDRDNEYSLCTSCKWICIAISQPHKKHYLPNSRKSLRHVLPNRSSYYFSHQVFRHCQKCVLPEISVSSGDKDRPCQLVIHQTTSSVS